MRPIRTMNVVAAALLGWSVANCQAEQLLTSDPPGAPADMAEAARSAVKAGVLCFRLSTPAELKALLGAPLKEQEVKDGDGKVLLLEYPGVLAIFARFGEGGGYCLVRVLVEGKPLDIGMGRTITLRKVDDLAKLDTFSGLANASLVKLDLREQQSQLSRLPFDNRTQWPPADRLPRGFEPARLLEAGKNPGLGVRRLHEQGTDGRGVHIAIIDQPLLREHREFKDGVVDYQAVDVEGAPPQMHGAAVASIAVGRECGTAPAASLHYYAVPMWKWWKEHSKPYAALLERIVEHNEDLPAGQRVRVVSLSLGAFSQWPDHELWTRAVKHAADRGMLVVSCDPADLRVTILKRNTDGDPELPTSYSRQWLYSSDGGLGVPAGNRTTAYYSGPEDYLFWRDAGLSWTAPYLAGLAALACQVNPDITPQAVTELWMKTAVKTPAGLVVDPPAFIEAVRKAPNVAKTVH